MKKLLSIGRNCLIFFIMKSEQNVKKTTLDFSMSARFQFKLIRFHVLSFSCRWHFIEFIQFPDRGRAIMFVIIFFCDILVTFSCIHVRMH